MSPPPDGSGPISRSGEHAAHGLVGRDAETARLRSFWAEALREGNCLVVSGAPGSGKTVLLAVGAGLAAQDGAKVLKAAGVEAEAELGYSGLNQLLMPVRTELEHLDPRHRSALEVAMGLRPGEAPSHRTVVNAVLGLLSRLCEQAPLLVVLDDLQWLDRSSSVVLGTAARHLSGMPVGLLTARRPEINTFFDVGALPQLDVDPLNAVAARRLVDECAPGLLPRQRRRVLSLARGNPLAIVELSHALLSQAPADWLARKPIALGPRLQHLFAPRIHLLPPATRHVLLLAALDTSRDLRTVLAAAAAAGLSEADLEPAEHMQLIEVWTGTEQQVLFANPLVRTTVVELSDDVEQRDAHRALAAALEDDLERRAWHLAQAALDPDEGVATILEQGARSVLRRGDATGAVELLLSAADLSPRSQDRSRRLSEAAYTAANVTGDLRSVLPLLAGAQDDYSVGGRSLETATAAAFVLLQGEGDVYTAHKLLAGAIEAHGYRGDGTPAALNEALVSLLFVFFYGARPDLLPTFRAALANAEMEIPSSLALSLRTLIDPASATREDVAQVRAAMARVERGPDFVEIWRVAVSGLYVDQLEHARVGLWRAVEDGRSGGAVTIAINALILLEFDAFYSGKWTDADQFAQEALDLCEKHGYRLVSWAAHYGRALVAAARGDYATSSVLAGEMTRWAEPRRIHAVLNYACHVRALEAQGRGDFEEAFRQASTISAAGRLESCAPQALRVVLDLVEAAVRAGRESEALAHVRTLRVADVAALSTRLALTVGAAEAIVAPESEAAELFERALALPDADRWPFDLARVQLVYGEHLRRGRAMSRARVPLEAALETFELMGAQPWAARAESELLATGLHRNQDDRALAVLTPREQEVAVLAASGLANRDIAQRLGMSSRTVGAHLNRVFTKLAIGSRAGLRDAMSALDRGPEDPTR